MMLFSRRAVATKYGANVIDEQTGMSLTIPAVLQMPPFWWEDRPDVYQRVLARRAELGLTVDDWDGGLQPVRKYRDQALDTRVDKVLRDLASKGVMPK